MIKNKIMMIKRIKKSMATIETIKAKIKVINSRWRQVSFVLPRLVTGSGAQATGQILR